MKDLQVHAIYQDLDGIVGHTTLSVDSRCANLIGEVCAVGSAFLPTSRILNFAVVLDPKLAAKIQLVMLQNALEEPK